MRFLPLAFILIIASISILLLLRTFTITWRPISQSIGFIIGDSEIDGVDPNAWKDGREKGQFKEPKVDIPSHYPIGKTKPNGSNYTRTLVVSKLRNEDTDWIQEELGDMLDSGLLNTAIYTSDRLNAALHVAENKGHEAMVYLNYIIDFYSDLADISIFMHAHRYAWHNNDILDRDSSLMVRHLSPERVTRDGYMNLRCHWDPGCPDWLKTEDLDYKDGKREQEVLAKSWAEMFPGEQIPAVLAQPCCAQFALSRERIQSIPRERFEKLRDWIIRTDLNDFLSGRVFEYTWQYIFTSLAFHCPSMSACYCDGYGICFGDPEKFDYYFELDYHRKKYEKELEEWESKALNATMPQQQQEDGMSTGQEASDVLKVGRIEQLKEELVRIEEDMKTRKAGAFERGKDPRQRAKEAGREWQEGDGF